MKRIITCFLLLVVFLSIMGCTKEPNGPDSVQPSGVYDVEKGYSMYPLFTTQEYTEKKSKFDVLTEDMIEPDDSPTIVSIDSINCDNLQTLFNTDLTVQELKENYQALWFIREEPIETKALENITYCDLFIENYQVYVTILYNEAAEIVEKTSYYEDLILIPNEWVNKIGSAKININLDNHLYLGTKFIMSYPKLQDFKNAYQELLTEIFNDKMYREVYILDAYGEYNDCLIVTAYFDGYVHPDDVNITTIVMENIVISYDTYYPMYVCYNSKLYTLQEAYDNGYLNLQNIKDFKHAYYSTFTKNDLSCKLETRNIRIMEEQYLSVMEDKPSLLYTYYKAENYQDYLKFLADYMHIEVEPLDKESSDKLFSEYVYLFFVRNVSYSQNHFIMDYYYDEFLRTFYKHLPKVEEGVDFPCEELGYCVDIVQVPIEVYNKMIK